MNWTDRPVLVTGAGGFIGSHLVEELVGRGAKVRAFVRYNSRGDHGLIDGLPPQVRDRIDVIAGDLRDADTVVDAMRDIAVVFHLAAQCSIPYSLEHPRDVLESNVFGTLNVLNAARAVRVERVVHTSTSEVYGPAQYAPLDENHPLVGQSPYAASKIAADQLAESYHRSFDVPVTTARPFNTYGPRQSTRAVVPAIIAQAITGERIFLGATHPTRDLTYVGDMVRGIVQVAECDEVIGRVTNLGSGEEVAIRDLVDRIVELVGREVEVIFDATRLKPEQSEVDRLLADNTRAREVVGWEPEIDLDEGLRRTIGWISERVNLQRPREFVI